MRTTIDGAGRVVIPKAIRDELGLGGGQEIDIVLRDGRVEIEAVPTPMRLVRERGRVVIRPERPLPPLTREQVRETLDRIRGERS